MKKVPALKGKSVLMLFYEPSTRTHSSFEVAAKRLSADVTNFDVAQSSITKGESVRETVETLQAMRTDFIIVRHKASGLPGTIAKLTKASVINAGDGSHAHPTQALLDAFTIKEKFPDPTGKKVLIVGDILHSRVARSTCMILKKLGVEVAYLGPGTYFVKVAEFGNNGTIGAYSLRASWTDGVPVATTGGRLVNLSILTSTTPESPTVIVGFVTTGTGAKSFLLRGVGPTLSSLGVGDAMADPKLQLFRGSAPLADNDNWGAGGALRDAATAVGAFQLPDNSRDAAMIQTLGAGAFTVQVNGGNGAVLVEAYEASANLATRLANVSARAFVGSGGGLLAGGFVIGGQGPRTLLIRAVGPGLAPFGVTDFLADPKLDIYSGRTVVQSNDNWGGTAALTATFARVGAFGLTGTSRDSVVLVTLQPGAYSAQVSSVGGAEGSVLLEVYEVP